jgi:hypothetical protein
MALEPYKDYEMRGTLTFHYTPGDSYLEFFVVVPGGDDVRVRARLSGTTVKVQRPAAEPRRRLLTWGG